MLHDFLPSNPNNVTSEEDLELAATKKARANYEKLQEEETEAHESLYAQEEEDRKRRAEHSKGAISGVISDIKDIGKSLTELADLAIAEFDEGDMSPQVNMALRQQIVQVASHYIHTYTTKKTHTQT
jgi:hypothetical protein